VKLIVAEVPGRLPVETLRPWPPCKRCPDGCCAADDVYSAGGTRGGARRIQWHPMASGARRPASASPPQSNQTRNPIDGASIGPRGAGGAATYRSFPPERVVVRNTARLGPAGPAQPPGRSAPGGARAPASVDSSAPGRTGPAARPATAARPGVSAGFRVSPGRPEPAAGAGYGRGRAQAGRRCSNPGGACSACGRGSPPPRVEPERAPLPAGRRAGTGAGRQGGAAHGWRLANCAAGPGHRFLAAPHRAGAGCPHPDPAGSHGSPRCPDATAGAGRCWGRARSQALVRGCAESIRHGAWLRSRRQSASKRCPG